MRAERLELPVRGPLHVPPDDFARPGLVNAGLVQRSTEAIRQKPKVLPLLRQFLPGRPESINAIDRLYRGELNQWAALTRQRLWIGYFTAEAILERLTSRQNE